MDAYITLNPYNYGAPQANFRTHNFDLWGRFYKYANLVARVNGDYEVPTDDNQAETVVLNDLTDTMIMDSQTYKVPFHISSNVSGYTIKLETTTNGLPPHILQNIVIYGEPTSLEFMNSFGEPV